MTLPVSVLHEARVAPAGGLPGPRSWMPYAPVLFGMETLADDGPVMVHSSAPHL